MSVHPVTIPDVRQPIKPQGAQGQEFQQPQQQQQQQQKQEQQPAQPQQQPASLEQRNEPTTQQQQQQQATTTNKKTDEQVQSKPDPSHNTVVNETCKSAFQELKTAWGKALFVLVTLTHLVLFFIPDLLLFKLGLRSNANRRFRLRRIITDRPRIWIGEYMMPVASSNCEIIKGKDGTLLIRSAPEPSPNIVQTIRDEGDPSAILLSVGHDTHAAKWKQMFPNVKMIAPQRDISIINDRVKVDMALEESKEFLKNFYITDIISTADWMRFDEPILLVELEESNKVAALFGCGIENNIDPLWSLTRVRDEIIGRARLKVISFFAYVFVKSPEKAHAMWQRLASTQNLEALIFLHGEPILGSENVKNCMLDVDMKCMKLAK